MKTIEVDGIKYIEVAKLEKNDGKDFVMVRTYSAGVHFGYVQERDDKNKIIKLSNARCVWSWEGAFTLLELATIGTTNANDCKFSITVPEIEIEWIEIIPITKESAKILNGVKDYDC